MDNNSAIKDNEFKKIIKDGILSIIPFVEKERSRMFFKYLFFLFIGIAVIAFIEYMSFKLMAFCANGGFSIWLGILWYLAFIWTFIALPCLSIILIFQFSKYYNNKVIRMIKNNILPKILMFFGDIEWIRHNSIAKDIVKFDEPKYLEFLEDMGDNEWAKKIIENIKNKKKDPEILTDKEISLGNFFNEYYDSRYTDDEFIGKYQEIEFKISETRLYETTTRGGKADVFRGLILKFKIPKNINNKIMIVSKGFLRGYSFASIFATLLSVFIAIEVGDINGGYAHWKLAAIFIAAIIGYFIGKSIDIKTMAGNTSQYDDIKKFKSFKIMSQNRIEKDEISYEKFLPTLQKLGKKFGAKGMKCSIENDNLIVTIGTNKNLFEIGNLYKPLSPSCIVNDFYNQMNAIYDFMDYIKNDENLN